MNLPLNFSAGTIDESPYLNQHNETYTDLHQSNNYVNNLSNSNTLAMLEMRNLTTLLVNASNAINGTGGEIISRSFDMYSTAAPSHSDPEAEIRRLVSIIVPICFGIIAVTGFFGNTLVILVVLFNQQMHSTTNLLIVNLAVADLLFVVFCIPFTAVDYMTAHWPFGDLWCRMVQYFIVVSAYVSIYTLVLMSIDRFLAVVHPIHSRQLRTEKVTKIAIATLWVVIVTVSIPVPFSHGEVVDIYPTVTYVSCTFMETNELLSQAAYQITFMATSYLLPLMVIRGLYVRMIMRLWHQGSGVQMSVKSQRGRKRVTRLVVVVVVAFALLWFPVQLILLLKSLDLYIPNTTFKVVLQFVAQTVAYISSCINPVLYAFLSDNFRKAFYKAIHCTDRYQNYSSDLPPPRRTSCAHLHHRPVGGAGQRPLAGQQSVASRQQ